MNSFATDLKQNKHNHFQIKYKETLNLKTTKCFSIVYYLHNDYRFVIFFHSHKIKLSIQGQVIL